MSDDDNGRPHLRLIGQPAQGVPPRDAEPPVASQPIPPAADAHRYPAGAWSALHDLTGQVVLLTGHGDGLDDAIATGLADHGARLAVAQRDVERAKLTAQIASRAGSQGSIAFALDASQPEHVRRGIGAVEQLTDRLDALVVIVDLGRATAGRGDHTGVSLGEMIHLVRAAERRMAVLGGGRILIAAGGAPRDPAVAAVTAGGVEEFVRTTAPAFAAQGVTVNGIVTALPAAPLAPPDAAAPTGNDQAGPPIPAAGTPAPANAALDQTPIIPFPAPAEGPPATPDTAGQEGVTPSVQATVGHSAPAVAAAILFLSPATAALTGQVIRVDGPRR